MNKAFEKILDRLEELRETYEEMAFVEMNTNGHNLDFEYAKGKKDVMLDVRKIVQEVAEEYKGGWIPLSERLPDNDSYILLSFENFSLPCVGRYEKDAKGGAFFVGDEEKSCISQDLFVNAWQPLPATTRTIQRNNLTNYKK